MITFKEFLSIRENLWGNIPVKGRKPSDGLSSKNNVVPMNKMMKKKMKKG
jgi:hypothetical protein